MALLCAMLMRPVGATLGMLNREITGEPEFTEMEGCMPDTHEDSLAPRDFPCHLNLTP